MLANYPLSKTEEAFFKDSDVEKITTKIPYLTVDNFPKLGLLTACRFLEWASTNPEGVISLPTGKTPEYFIKWTKFLLENWEEKKGLEIRKKYGLIDCKKPVLNGLHFVQIDEFYPISAEQNNSFHHYVNKFYIEGFGLDPKKALLINSDEIPLAEGKSYKEVFPDSKVDLTLRFREYKTPLEKLQQESIYLIDQWCGEYEAKIREKGGIGFFLGGIGPDGHIAFNTRGSDIFSTTRLTETNFETQAVAAGDLGGIEISANRLVITIGLDTIVHNPDAVAIIIAAGEAKAGIVKESLEQSMTNIYPATVLQKLKNGRFYITKGAGSKLTDSTDQYYFKGEWNNTKTERSVLDLCKKLQKYGHRITLEDLKNDKYTSQIPDLNEHTVKNVIKSISEKIDKGMQEEKNEVFLHTGPHHDDISLGILPQITKQLHEISNEAHFAVLTSGFTAVTNTFVIETLRSTKRFLDNGRIQMVNFEDFYTSGYKLKMDKDVYHYLTNVASDNAEERLRGLCHRVVRAIVFTFGIKSTQELREQINEIITVLKNSYDGEKNPKNIQTLKGMIREFEEELVWAHFGVQVKNVHHLRLGFYTGDIFTEQPDKKRDVEPILNMLREIKPTKLSLTLDPEGSGPDTHYKVLQATAEAVRQWSLEEDLSDFKIVGYRNVWFKFDAAESNVIVPVSLGDISVMEDSFSNCYLSQVNASFPSYAHNGKFSTLAKNTWVDQLSDVQLLLGKNYFYQHQSAKVRSSHGLIFFREMDVEDFLVEARELEKSTEGML
ncbi:PIG-L family deacetylase [Cyclobacterium marinum]|mgnify:FL=1|uniref:Glucosamine/galactosamine-6-phosphate isomerase n=1 Tax=Cyclobacterium marinum (strain ATCC 25205 / DSM 745 / LMG 13164 / NCIMB 1802) TaxID=880070 RepID=G0IUD5_CYCMS|nr:PIG-L family deacetylase [Cyclobacterium marinum]AEL24130.1 glucosamine/galactosamine-6-phosphate isomerase [Cyclobacterium marinum DSM 745]MBR9778048.1 glucosamine-6-phosphate isomerase [Cytophagales bacterium]|tara:strand:+ start:20152 stop:22479 length:2328 start_codon:yes stop_codon:yes gene_type:complete